MKRILAVMLVGLLLIGAASANLFIPMKPGKAISCADAYAKGKANVDASVVATSWDDLVICTGAGAITYQIDDAKVDPIAVSLSAGTAVSGIDGKLEFGMGFCKDVANVNIDASSYAQAYDYSRGSIFAKADTDTFNSANTWANEWCLGSESKASSESFGYAVGFPAWGAKEQAGSDMFGWITEDLASDDDGEEPCPGPE